MATNVRYPAMSPANGEGPVVFTVHAEYCAGLPQPASHGDLFVTSGTCPAPPVFVGSVTGFMPISPTRFLVLAVTFLVPVVAAAQEAPMELQRLSAPITVDGRLDEPAWQQVRPL